MQQCLQSINTKRVRTYGLFKVCDKKQKILFLIGEN